MGNQDVLCISGEVTKIFCESSQTGNHDVLSIFDKVIKIHLRLIIQVTKMYISPCL